MAGPRHVLILMSEDQRSRPHGYENVTDARLLLKGGPLLRLCAAAADVGLHVV